MIKNLRPADGSEQLEREGGSGDIVQGKPCFSVLITAPAVCDSSSRRNKK